MYIYLKKDWPNFHWDANALLDPLSRVRFKQGRLLGKMDKLGFTLQKVASFENISADILKSHEIEGEYLDQSQVRSSLARRLGLDFENMVNPSQKVEGLVEMMLEATRNYKLETGKERLCNWHKALFPDGKSGLFDITLGDWRKDENGPMQVVSGPMGKEKVHFEAPAARKLDAEMKAFLDWYNSQFEMDSVLKAGVAHLWLLTLHPFDDGNGRIARAFTDMQLSRSDDSALRFYTLSRQILKDKKAYYDALENAQKGGLDITAWLIWFLECLERAIDNAHEVHGAVLLRADFWEKHQNTKLNDRQRRIIDKLLDGFFGKLNTSKWAKMCKCSTDTALRDIQDLEKKGILKRLPAGGRSTAYQLQIGE